MNPHRDESTPRRRPAARSAREPAARRGAASSGREIDPVGRLLAEVLLEESGPLAHRCRARLADEGYFVSPERLELRAVARVAFARLVIGEEGAARGACLGSCVERALADLVDEPLREELVGAPPERSADRELYESFARRARMDVASARTAIVALNEGTPAMRDCFRALVLDGVAPDEHAARTRRSVASVRRTLAHTLDAVRRALRERARRDSNGSRPA